MNRATRRALGQRGRKPVIWCDCCQDAPATVRSWQCPRCGFLAMASIDVALADPHFETCPNCDP